MDEESPMIFSRSIEAVSYIFPLKLQVYCQIQQYESIFQLQLLSAKFDQSISTLYRLEESYWLSRAQFI